MIFDRHANMKYKYGNRQFWGKGYYVDTVGRNKKIIEEYIKNQIQEDLAYEQLSLEGYIDPFTGGHDLRIEIYINLIITFILAIKYDMTGKFIYRCA